MKQVLKISLWYLTIWGVASGKSVEPAEPTRIAPKKHHGRLRQEQQARAEWNNWVRNGGHLRGGENVVMLFTESITYGALTLDVGELLTTTTEAIFQLGNHWPDEVICKKYKFKNRNCVARSKANGTGFKTAARSIAEVSISAAQLCTDAPLLSTEKYLVKTAKLQNWQRNWN